MVKMNRVEGKDKAKILVYTLSTCGWCARTKEFLNDLGVRYSFVEVDTLAGDELQEVRSDIQRLSGRVSFPTIVINDQTCVVGYNTEKIVEAIG